MGDPVTVGMMVGGTLLSAYGAYSEGEAAEDAAEYEAKQMEAKASEERATTHRRMYEEMKKRDRVLSNAQAASAASGGGTMDESVMNIMGNLAAEGQYNSDVAKYEGETAARSLESGAGIRRFEGRAAKQAGKMQAVATTVSGLAGARDSDAGQRLWEKYR